jgi:outer membrane biosynthesis protein TonB
MRLSACGDATIAFERRPAVTRSERARRVGWGVIGSLVLHVVAVLLILFALPRLLLVPPAEILVPIDLVRLGDRTASPPSPDHAALPQERAPESAQAEPADPVPVAGTPPPPEAEPADAKEATTAGKQPVVAPQAKPEPPKTKARPKTDHPATVAPPPKARPVDDLAARLKSLAQQQLIQASRPPNPRLQDGVGASNVTASDDSAALGRSATYDVRDFIRVQIERHWRPDVGAAGAGEVLIAIHLTLNRDGSVGSAEIVDDPRYRGSAAYRSLALSARNAALVSSPLTLPPGRYDEVRDMVLNFNPRNALR